MLPVQHSLRLWRQPFYINDTIRPFAGYYECRPFLWLLKQSFSSVDYICIVGLLYIRLIDLPDVKPHQVTIIDDNSESLVIKQTAAEPNNYKTIRHKLTY